MADFSPMMKQYFEIKEKYPNTILFFRLGDFYEMFFNDAKTVAREVEIVLTGKMCGKDERAPMCGIPYHSADSYIARLVEKGYKVAICEQTENPKFSKGIVKREVIRVITPGTVLESSMLDETKNNYLCSVCYEELSAGLCFADISTGELKVSSVNFRHLEDLEASIMNDLSRYHPSEILINPEGRDLSGVAEFIREKLTSNVECLDVSEFDKKQSAATVCEQFGCKTLADISLSDEPLIVRALGSTISYLKRTQIVGVERLNEITFSDQNLMAIDITAMKNLELTETIRNRERRGSLLWVLDKTETAMGKRLIKTWIEQPLLNPAKITLRLSAVEELFGNPMILDALKEELKGIYDLERIMSRIVHGSANGRELRSLSYTLQKVPGIKELLAQCEATLITDIDSQMQNLGDICSLINAAIVPEPPFSIREGGMIQAGFSEELDELQIDKKGGQSLIAQIEAEEKEKTGIPKLKVGYNRVFGYFIEIPKTYKDKVPESYIRKQTISSSERYITEELKVIENRILGAHEKSVSLESDLFEKVRKQVADQLVRIQKTAKAIGILDVLASFALVSITNDYTRPTINMSGKLYLKNSRHPVVETLLHDVPFVPNDVDMDMSENRVAIITGPNMAGKSTFMRQVAVLTIMAQIGCFVPASVAEIGIVDKIFTRVGASDDLSSGQSTFMIEMAEVAEILKKATKESLIIFDEIGRGTSTFDGMSIAKAVLEYVQDKKTLGAKTLFATHYHELITLEASLSGVKNYNIAVKKKGDEITFLRRIIRGGADESFGIEVAKLAGVPQKVIKRAKEVLEELEREDSFTSKVSEFYKDGSPLTEPVQLELDSPETEVLTKLKQVDINALTPIECMNTLFELVKLVKNS